MPSKYLQADTGLSYQILLPRGKHTQLVAHMLIYGGGSSRAHRKPLNTALELKKKKKIQLAATPQASPRPAARLHRAKPELPPREGQDPNCTFCKAPGAIDVPRSIPPSPTDILSKKKKKSAKRPKARGQNKQTQTQLLLP